jgi:L-alanine-DL-glutamate epimerase-like enolase superfamily enzyme
MPEDKDARITKVTRFFLPVETRVPLKFGTEALTHVTCIRVSVEVANAAGRSATGWGETPLNVQWVWPSNLSYEARLTRLQAFCDTLGTAWRGNQDTGHALEVGHRFIEKELPKLLAAHNEAADGPPMPWLAALVCCSAYDIALHDAYATLHDVGVYDTYTSEFLNIDLATFLVPEEGSGIDFSGRFPADFLVSDPATTLRAWHLVGGMDLLEDDERTGSEPDDGYPVTLREWISTDGLTCLKIKLRGNDESWDYDRILRVGQIALEMGVLWLSVDFNCTVTDPAYVNTILDRLLEEAPHVYAHILYVEQPFPYELEEYRIDVHSVSARKPLFMDESAHDWRLVRLGRRLGWTGVALKTCKTQTGALLSLCWARAHGMTLMVQDLTNPMLAQIPHVELAAHAGTIMGVETNGMQFYPDASACEAAVHPGLYRRREGRVARDTLGKVGFGYRVEEITRSLPEGRTF